MSMEPDIELMIDEDKVLWDSISRGDKKAFNDFFMKYYTLLYEYSRYYVSAEDAKEVLQELMMWLWENRVTFVLGTTSSLRQYLITSVRHRCLNVLRKQKKGNT
ncbi:sigma-70 family RNA polymerase sigma factor [Bacteroides thetaiotaomicron]|uniref:sigma-70 family RNA polymerase sigma factor n=1 Tax=Bacteroides thetaiotaomicron TaxID=818 RepID=UPI002165A263|nr:sigma-70 family RNA polymerase sigma factor [Bacteroides thetaiotaomicron]MCS2873055.1 sigma-70 family RNA polymerase sigma factor [Bacteroides thetaiotaomicron]